MELGLCKSIKIHIRNTVKDYALRNLSIYIKRHNDLPLSLG